MKTIILLCALSLARADCNVDTASDVIIGPPSWSLWACMFQGQAYAADVVSEQRRAGHYIVVKCQAGERVHDR